MREKKKTVKCAGGCKTELPRVDEHAVGWRPICEPCFRDGKASLFNQFWPQGSGEHVVRAVRERVKDA